MKAARYSQEAQQTLLRWAYSRKPEQVEWESGAETRVAEIAGEMCRIYHNNIPLVEQGSQWLRIAKLAVSVAVQCFSTTIEDPEVVLVKVVHVNAAAQLFILWFNSKSFGYQKWSVQQKSKNELRDIKAVAEVFEQVTDGPALAATLLSEQDFSERQFRRAIAGERVYAEEWLSCLILNRALKQVRHSEKYEKTPAFTRWLETYSANGKTPKETT
jgi:hypothetical protein